MLLQPFYIMRGKIGNIHNLELRCKGACYQHYKVSSIFLLSMTLEKKKKKGENSAN